MSLKIVFAFLFLISYGKMLDNHINGFKLCKQKIDLCVQKCNRKHEYKISTGKDGFNHYKIKRNKKMIKTTSLSLRKVAKEGLRCARRCYENSNCLQKQKSEINQVKPHCSLEISSCRLTSCPGESTFYIKGKNLPKKEKKNMKIEQVKEMKKNEKIEKNEHSLKKLSQRENSNSSRKNLNGEVLKNDSRMM